MRYDHGIFVVTGARGTILLSSDGTTWEIRNSGAEIPPMDIVHHGGVYVAASGGRLFVSSDGTKWKKKNLGAEERFFGVA